jgi:hypothetical protein
MCFWIRYQCSYHLHRQRLSDPWFFVIENKFTFYCTDFLTWIASVKCLSNNKTNNKRTELLAWNAWISFWNWLLGNWLTNPPYFVHYREVLYHLLSSTSLDRTLWDVTLTYNMLSLCHALSYSLHTSLPLIRRHIILAAECNICSLSHVILCIFLVLPFSLV